MTSDKYKVPLSMLSPIVDPGRLGFYGRAAQRLEEMAQAVAEWGEPEGKSDGQIFTES